jgi:DNA-binding NarL/FixJ family response regulator
VRADLRAILAPEPDMSVVGSAADQHELWARAAARVDPADHTVLAIRLAGVVPTDIAAMRGLPIGAAVDPVAAIVATRAQRAASPSAAGDHPLAGSAA